MNKTYCLAIEGLPRIAFSHIFGAQSYHSKFVPRQCDGLFFEITYVTAGELLYIWEDGTSIRTPAHTLICNRQSTHFQVLADRAHEHHTVGFFVPGRLVSETEAAPPTGTLQIPMMLFHLPEGENPFLPMLDEIILSRAMQSRGEIGCSALVLSLLDKIDRYARRPTQLPYVNRTHIKQAKSYIFEHMREPIRQNEIARHLGISCEYLCSIFKKTEGITVMQFINRTKMRQLIAVMKTDGISLAEAAEMYGYSDPNYVSRLYKSLFGCTVTEALQRKSTAEFSAGRK